MQLGHNMRSFVVLTPTVLRPLVIGYTMLYIITASYLPSSFMDFSRKRYRFL
jgi:ABC-type molybdate transport system permease subunit